MKKWIVNDQLYKTVDYFASEQEALRFASDLIENRAHYDIVIAKVEKEIKK
jgi:hypothetical protein